MQTLPSIIAASVLHHCFVRCAAPRGGAFHQTQCIHGCGYAWLHMSCPKLVCAEVRAISFPIGKGIGPRRCPHTFSPSARGRTIEDRVFPYKKDEVRGADKVANLSAVELHRDLGSAVRGMVATKRASLRKVGAAAVEG